MYSSANTKEALSPCIPPERRLAQNSAFSSRATAKQLEVRSYSGLEVVRPQFLEQSGKGNGHRMLAPGPKVGFGNSVVVLGVQSEGDKFRISFWDYLQA